VKERLSSLLSLTLVCLILLLQLAGSNPYLHGYLHDTGKAESSCANNDKPCGHVPADAGDDSCDKSCPVVLLASGVVLTPSLQVDPIEWRFSGETIRPLVPVSLPGSLRLFDARAPPVL
jgi:hypothetical protein